MLHDTQSLLQMCEGAHVHVCGKETLGRAATLGWEGDHRGDEPFVWLTFFHCVRQQTATSPHALLFPFSSDTQKAAWPLPCREAKDGKGV